MQDDGQRGEGSETRARVKKALRFLNHNWFEGRFLEFGTAGANAMVLLLLNVYASTENGKPLNKTAAKRIMGIADARTSSKFIEHAVSNKMIQERRSERDKRVVHLFSTPLLSRMLKKEMPKLI